MDNEVARRFGDSPVDSAPSGESIACTVHTGDGGAVEVDNVADIVFITKAAR
jgi:hypothetical protein